MKSYTTIRFRKAFKTLPEQVQRMPRKAFEKWEHDPHHPSLRFKKIHSDRLIFSVRVSLDYRAIRVCEGDHMICFWIGSHADYKNLISHL